MSNEKSSKFYIPLPKHVQTWLDNNKGGTVEIHHDPDKMEWVYSFKKKGETMSNADVKCVECDAQGLADGSAKTQVHCLECMHCQAHCTSLYTDCLCCCVTSHCEVCTWHVDTDDCDMFECSCCCNTHCIQCGHEQPEACKESGDKCTCCGCYTSNKMKPDKANNVNKEWLKILTGSHLNKINPKHLGPKDILKDIGLFYILLAHGDKKMLDDHKKLLAQRLLNYLMVSCAGEARHTLSKAHGDITTLSEMSQTILVAKSKNSDLMNRQYMWSAIYDLAQVSGEGVIMESLEEMFNLEWTTSSYGGKKWAKIAELAKNYCKGDYTESIFIDGIMNVVHNGGWAFNKYYKSSAGGNYYNKGITMMKLLDYKKEATLKSIYALLVPMGVENTDHVNMTLYKKAVEYGVIDETGALTAEYGLLFDKVKDKPDPYYPMHNKVKVPSAAYIEYIKQQQEVTLVA